MKKIDDPAAVRRLLGELRDLRAVTAASRACIDPATWRKPVLLRLHTSAGSEAFLLRGDSCRVVGPAGGPAHLTDTLWADVNALIGSGS